MKKFILSLVISMVAISFANPQQKGKPIIQTLSPSTNVTGKNAQSFPGLKAVLVVGPIEDMTSEAIGKVREIAAFLRSRGIRVIELYDPDATWDRIVSAADGAHIFLYSGHGTTMGFYGRTGGLCLSKQHLISAVTIVKDLHLHKDALILFHTVCMGAGSSAGDDKEIDLNLAVQRVTDYALAFVKLGAGGYYANNYSGSVIPFLEAFFEKKTIKEIYETEASRFCTIETIRKYSYDSAYEVSVASSNFSTGTVTRTTYVNGTKKTEKIPVFKSYDVAFVSRPGFSIEDLTR
jgi:hypothetical protein